MTTSVNSTSNERTWPTVYLPLAGKVICALAGVPVVATVTVLANVHAVDVDASMFPPAKLSIEIVVPEPSV